MNGQELCGQVCGVLLLLLLLLLLGQSVAVAPGDEDGRCPVPEYPVNVKVLMDSWRYHTLIAEGDGNGVWIATTTGQRRRMTPMEPITWSSQGTCNGSSVSVCSGGWERKWLLTQFINKTLPAPNTYPVRIFVNITYSFMSCPRRHCDDNFELLLANFSNGTSYQYGEGGIMPDNSIQNTSGISSDTKQLFFDSETSFAGIFLALRSFEACVTVSRVLVYRYECPGQDRLPTDLLRRSATPAPVGRSLEPITPYCAENSHLNNKTSTILCRSDGVWVNGNARCECDSGYTEDQEGTTCKALPSQSTTGYIAQQTVSPSTTSALPTNGATHKTTVVGEIVTSVSREKTPPLSPYATPSLPTAGTTEEPTVDSRARDSGSGLPIPIVAGVGALVVVILALILVVVLVLVIVRNHKKSKQNENRNFPNSLYNTTQHGILTNGVSESVVVISGDPCTTTENVAYAATAKFATHDPVYEDIPSATTDDPVTAENVAYETTVIPTACNPAYESVARQDLAISSATAAT